MGSIRYQTELVQLSVQHCRDALYAFGQKIDENKVPVVCTGKSNCSSLPRPFKSTFSHSIETLQEEEETVVEVLIVILLALVVEEEQEEQEQQQQQQQQQQEDNI